MELFFDRGTIVVLSGGPPPPGATPREIRRDRGDRGHRGGRGDRRADRGDQRLLFELKEPSEGKDGEALPSYFRWDRRVNQWRAPGCFLPHFGEWLRARRLELEYHSSRPDGF